MSAASEGRGEWVGWTESDIFRGGLAKMLEGVLSEV